MKHYENGCARSEIKITPAGWDIDITRASERAVSRLMKKSGNFTTGIMIQLMKPETIPM
jgi:hypothetical protein